jgi:two-component system sensor histidine kinase CreC
VAARFIDNILVQNARMQSLVEKLLTQARLENRVEITPEVSVSIRCLRGLLTRARRCWRQKYYADCPAFASC